MMITWHDNSHLIIKRSWVGKITFPTIKCLKRPWDKKLTFLVNAANEILSRKLSFKNPTPIMIRNQKKKRSVKKSYGLFHRDANTHLVILVHVHVYDFWPSFLSNNHWHATPTQLPCHNVNLMNGTLGWNWVRIIFLFLWLANKQLYEVHFTV